MRGMQVRASWHMLATVMRRVKMISAAALDHSDHSLLASSSHSLCIPGSLLTTEHSPFTPFCTPLAHRHIHPRIPCNSGTPTSAHVQSVITTTVPVAVRITFDFLAR